MSKKPTRDPDSKKVAAPLRLLAKISKKSAQSSSDTELAPETEALALDIGRMIESARAEVAQTANAALTTLYWQIGTRIRQDVLNERRAEYSAEIVAALRVASAILLLATRSLPHENATQRMDAGRHLWGSASTWPHAERY